MAQNNNKRYKLLKSVHIILCIVVVNAVFWVGLGFFLFQKSTHPSPEVKGQDFSVIYKNLQNFFNP
jgi:hypothetical protein